MGYFKMNVNLNSCSHSILYLNGIKKLEIFNEINTVCKEDIMLR